MKRRFDHALKFILRPLGSLSFWRVSDRLGDASSAELALSLSKEASLSIGDTSLRPRLFGKCTVVDASEEEGAWLEAFDGERHALHGSSSLGRTGANRIVLDSPKVSR